MREIDVPIRAALSLGECEIADGKVAGIAVNVGAGVASFAEADDVLVSQTVHDLVVSAPASPSTTAAPTNWGASRASGGSRRHRQLRRPGQL